MNFVDVDSDGKIYQVYLKPEWQGTLVGKDVANDTTARWSGKVVKGADVLAAVSKTYNSPTDVEAKKVILQKYFNEQNTTQFFKDN